MIAEAILAPDSEQIESSIRRPVWETAPYGVVSLLVMLKFAAEDFWEASQLLGRLIENTSYAVQRKARTTAGFSQMMKHCRDMGLSVSLAQLEKIRAEYETDSETLTDARISQHWENLADIIHSELAASLFRHIKSEKAQYCDPGWLVGTPIQDKFPRAHGEFQSAGRCYAYGENTACAFHLNRALEDGLKALAVAVGQSFHKNSWDAHLKDVERELERRYKAAGARTADEHFYSDLSTQFGHMKTAWRNPTMHVESKYDERDALYLLQTTQRFIEGLCEHGLKQGDLV